MKSKEEVMLESKISDILIDLVEQSEELREEMTISDLQGYLMVKAMDIIKLVRDAK